MRFLERWIDDFWNHPVVSDRVSLRLRDDITEVQTPEGLVYSWTEQILVVELCKCRSGKHKVVSAVFRERLEQSAPVTTPIGFEAAMSASLAKVDTERKQASLARHTAKYIGGGHTYYWPDGSVYRTHASGLSPEQKDQYRALIEAELQRFRERYP
jgi:hypothetical protein